MVYFSFPHLSWVHRKGVVTDPLSPEPGCGDYSFLDQTVADIEQGLDFILIDSFETPELDTSLDEPDAITSSVPSGCFHLVSTILILSNCSLPLALGLTNCGARLGCLFPLCLLLTRFQHLNWFTTSSHPAAFGFLPSTPPDNITLPTANRKADQSLSEFQTGIGAATHITLDRSSSFLASEVRSGLQSSPFFMVSRMWFLLVRLACMAVQTGLWHRLSNNPP